MTAQDWAAEAREVGLNVRIDSRRGLLHSSDPRFHQHDWETDCGAWGATADEVRIEFATQVCMHCREQPGRRKHEREVVGA